MSSHQAEVVVAGHLCLDITPEFGDVSGSRVEEILRPGKLLVVKAAEFSTGGPVSNTGLALRRLDVETSLMGKCGDDPLGQILLQKLREESPEAADGTKLAKGEVSSYTIVLVPPGIDRMFLHCPGANDTFSADDIDLDVVRGARLFHFGYPPLMKKMYESGGQELERMFREVAQEGVVTSLDLALPDPDSDAGRSDWRAILGRALPLVDLFMPSLEEALFTLRRGRFEELQSNRAESIADLVSAADVRSLAEECISMGVKAVVIKCGHVGAYLRTASDLGGLAGIVGNPGDWTSREIFEPTCRVDNIVSATGAGDSAIAGFLAALLRGEPPERCMAFLAVVGAQNLSAIGAVTGVKSWEETVAEVNRGPQKNPVADRLKDLVK